MIMEIKQLNNTIMIKFDQYECNECGKKCYINSEDKSNNIICAFCGGPTKNSRIFDLEIKGIGEY